MEPGAARDTSESQYSRFDPDLTIVSESTQQTRQGHHKFSGEDCGTQEQEVGFNPTSCSEGNIIIFSLDLMINWDNYFGSSKKRVQKLFELV